MKKDNDGNVILSMCAKKEVSDLFKKPPENQKQTPPLETQVKFVGISEPEGWVFYLKNHETEEILERRVPNSGVIDDVISRRYGSLHRFFEQIVSDLGGVIPSLNYVDLSNFWTDKICEYTEKRSKARNKLYEASEALGEFLEARQSWPEAILFSQNGVIYLKSSKEGKDLEIFLGAGWNYRSGQMNSERFV